MFVKLCLDKNFINTHKHILYDVEFGDFALAQEVPQDAWFISNQPSFKKNINEIAKLNNLSFSLSPPQKYINIFNHLRTDLSKINWQKTIPKIEYKSWVQSLFQEAKEIIKKSDTLYYENIFQKIKYPIYNLKGAKINVSFLKKYLDQEINSTQKSILKSFLPTNDGYATKTIYDITSGITGRLSVKSGPQILTLRKEYRNILSSRYGNKGKIVILDFVSLEPRLALYLAGHKNIEEDVYEQLSKNLFNGELPRKIIKSFVLCVLYGMSIKNLENEFHNEKWKVKDISDKIYEFFDIRKHIEKLVCDLHENGYIQTYLGRKIYLDKDVSPYVLYNYKIQGSAVELGMLGFANIVEFIKRFKLKVYPLFVLHDSLVLDVFENEMYRMWDLKQAGMKIKELDEIDFHLKKEEI